MGWTASSPSATLDMSTLKNRSRRKPLPTYSPPALANFGETGVAEATRLEGYYTFFSIVMNTARTALPAGAKSTLAPQPANR